MSVGTKVTTTLTVVTLVVLGIHLMMSTPAWIVGAGGLTFTAFVVAVIVRWQRSAELEDDLY